MPTAEMSGAHIFMTRGRPIPITTNPKSCCHLWTGNRCRLWTNEHKSVPQCLRHIIVYMQKMFFF